MSKIDTNVEELKHKGLNVNAPNFVQSRQNRQQLADGTSELNLTDLNITSVDCTFSGPSTAQDLSYQMEEASIRDNMQGTHDKWNTFTAEIDATEESFFFADHDKCGPTRNGGGRQQSGGDGDLMWSSLKISCPPDSLSPATVHYSSPNNMAFQSPLTSRTTPRTTFGHIKNFESVNAFVSPHDNYYSSLRSNTISSAHVRPPQSMPEFGAYHKMGTFSPAAQPKMNPPSEFPMGLISSPRSNQAGCSRASASKTMGRNMEPVDGYVYQVQFKRAHKNFILAPSAPRNIIPGDFVKVEADRGEDMGIVLSKAPASDFEEVIPTAGYRGRGFSSGQGERKFLFRVATAEERAALVDKVRDEEHALATIREKSLEHGLPMVILDAEYQFDRHKLTFFFEADRRIDFRELVSELFSQYKTRIWMQQVDTSVLPIHDAGTELAKATGFLPMRDDTEYLQQQQQRVHPQRQPFHAETPGPAAPSPQRQPIASQYQYDSSSGEGYSMNRGCFEAESFHRDRLSWGRTPNRDLTLNQKTTMPGHMMGSDFAITLPLQYSAEEQQLQQKQRNQGMWSFSR